ERLAGPLESRSPASTLVVVLGPERPLCGALPRRLARAAREVSGRLVLVGRRFAEAYEAVPGGPEPERVLGGPSSAGELDEASRRLAAVILEADAEEVELRHPIPGGAVHRSVLLGGLRAARRDPPETFSPVDVVLADAVREATTARLRVALAEALRVELAARLTAAQAARRAVEDKEEELRSAWRVARHERITTEILELQRSD
ncbi:MAG: hypothetical protein CMH59_24655, partial [Myxococcales bacterium]|nr:hypothetical protein [Myxococcales bacterium]